MKYISTKNKQEIVSFEEAVVKGLAKNKGLFMPETIPQLDSSFFETIEKKSNTEIAFEALYPYVKASIDKTAFKQILEEVLSFEFPVVRVNDNIYSLELYHGPTQAFKDVGARFMSRCLAHFIGKDKEVHILVATSGDTGSAVANGFYNVDGVQVHVLFPKGKVSPYQEYQMTSLGKNIHALEVDGVFDDCQDLVKQAFNDDELNQHLNLSSANSINIARLLPQMLYYFYAYRDLKKANKELVVSVPSGNFGNLTAGLIAKKMGLPIQQFIAANNDNDTFYQYYKTATYTPKASVQTYSNAMDVGAPSNFERMMHLYENDWENLKKDVVASVANNEETLAKMDSVHKESNYILDPHGAVGVIGLDQYLNSDQLGVVLETAHPRKFESVVQKVISSYPDNEVDLEGCQKLAMANSYVDFKNYLLGL